MWRALAIVSAGLVLAGPANADLDVGDYAPTAGPASRKEQAQLEPRIVEEQKNEADRVRQEAELNAMQAAAERARLDARPYPLRITEQRCTACHIANFYMQQRHTWIGWSVVTLRMKYLNGASHISEAERETIVAYLTALRSAESGEALQEYAAVAAVGGPLAAVWIGLVLRARRSRKTNVKMAE